ncbi:MAG: PQQ-binding-like beta-propeller repeat protein, partial [Planctomycetales bacterium]
MRRIVAVRFPAPIYASPAVVGNRIYAQDARGNMACVDAATNRPIWTRPLGGINNASSPAVARGRVYVGSTADAFFILDANNGDVVRRIPTSGGVVSAPAIVGESIYFSTFNGNLVKINHDGDVIWTFDGGRTSITEFAASKDRIVFFAGTDNTIQYVLRDAGDSVKVVSKRASPGQTCPTGGPVLIGDSDHAFQCFDSEFGTFFLGDRILALDAHETRATPSARGTRLYRGDKTWELNGLKRNELRPHPQRSGQNAPLLWRADPKSLYDGGFHSSPALARDVLAVGTERGSLLFFSLEGTDQPLWQATTTRASLPNDATGSSRAISSSPAIID